MNASCVPFVQIPQLIIDGITQPRALQIINHLFKYCNMKNAVVWVHQGWLAQRLGIHRDSLGRWIRTLERLGWLIFTGKYTHGRCKIYEIAFKPESTEIQPRSDFLASDEKIGLPPTQTLDIVRSFHQNINIKEKTDEIKEQTTKQVCLPEIIKENPEESQTRLKLQNFGIGKNQAKELCRKFPEERIERQIENLGEAIMQRKEIKNKAGWLIKAIRDNFYPSRAQEIKQQAVKESKEREKRLDAEQLYQRARDLEMRGQYPEAKKEALASLAINSSTAAHNLLATLEKLIGREDAISKARAAISDEQWEAIRCEELEKHLVITRKLGGPKLDKLAQLNAITAANERLLSV